jgi:DNA-binding IclR family transcriptional regulator
MDPRHETHVLAAGVHGALVALHTLGVAYNARRGNRWQLWAHVAGVAFSVYATVHHARAVASRS